MPVALPGYSKIAALAIIRPPTMTRHKQIADLQKEWSDSSRWKKTTRGYCAEDVVRLRGSIQPEYTYARQGAIKLWALIHGAANKGYVNCLGALTAGQALQQAKAGVEAIYLSGWQVAAEPPVVSGYAGRMF